MNLKNYDIWFVANFLRDLDIVVSFLPLTLHDASQKTSFSSLMTVTMTTSSPVTSNHSHNHQHTFTCQFCYA